MEDAPINFHAPLPVQYTEYLTAPPRYHPGTPGHRKAPTPTLHNWKSTGEHRCTFVLAHLLSAEHSPSGVPPTNRRRGARE